MTERCWWFWLVLGDLGRVKEEGIALEWMLSGSGGNSVIKYLNQHNLYGKKKATRLKLSLVKKQQSLLSAWRGFFGHCCGTGNAHIFVCVQT